MRLDNFVRTLLQVPKPNRTVIAGGNEGAPIGRECNITNQVFMSSKRTEEFSFSQIPQMHHRAGSRQELALTRRDSKRCSSLRILIHQSQQTFTGRHFPTSYRSVFAT